MPNLGFHQAAMYDAQCEAGSGRRWTDIRRVREYVDALLASDEFQDAYPDFHCDVMILRRGRGASWSGADPATRTIWLAVLEQRTVLHEIAHLIAPCEPDHGPEFARVFLDLVRREMGFHAYGAFLSALKRTYAFRGCDLTPTCGRV